jgi:hypothetical protein
MRGRLRNLSDEKTAANSIDTSSVDELVLLKSRFYCQGEDRILLVNSRVVFSVRRGERFIEVVR